MTDVHDDAGGPELVRYNSASRTRSLVPAADVEQALFAAAAESALTSAEITGLIGRYMSAADIRAAIGAQEEPAWQAVEVERERFRESMMALREAWQTVRRGVLEENEEPKWVQEREELDRRLSSAQDYLAARRRTYNQAEADSRITDVNAALRAAEALLLQATATPQTPPGGDEPRESDQAIRGGRRRRNRAAPGVPEADPVERARQEFQSAQESLFTLQRAAADFAMADRQRLLALEPEIGRRIRQDPGCQTALAGALAARDALAAELLAQGTLPAAREFVNSRLGNLTALTMTLPPESGLYDTVPRTSPVTTYAMQRVQDWLGRMKGASIGIAGPRGSGKTTLLDYFCLTGPPRPSGERWVQVRVSAPVEYVPLDFIRYLLAQFCAAILELHPDHGSPAVDSAPPPEGRARRALRGLKRIQTGAALPVLAALLALLAVPVIGGIGLSSHQARDAVLVTSLSMSLAAILWVQLSSRSGWIDDPGGRQRRLALAVSLMVPLWALVVVVATLAGWPRRVQWDQFAASVLGGIAIVLLVWVTTGFRLGWRPVSGPARAAAMATAPAVLVAVAAAWWAPTRPALLSYGCTVIATGAAVSFILLSFAATARRAIAVWALFAAGGLAAAGFSWYPAPVDVALCLVCGLLAVGAGWVAYPQLLLLMPWWLTRRLRPRSLDDPYLSPRPDRNDPAVVGDDAQAGELARHAAELLGYIEYAQTLSTGLQQTWTAGIGGNFPLSFANASSSGSSWARQPWSVPAAVEQFRKLARETVRSHGGVIIGIDELDKLEYDKSTAFLNDIKAVFGVPGTFFLVSVSENAAAGFERRGVPFRDVFDSSFDDIITVGYLTWQQSQELLNRLVVGMPAPFAALCHVFAGGLARDLIRAARSVLADREPGAELVLSAAAGRLCLEEMLGKAHGVFRELATLSSDAFAMSLLAHVQSSDESFREPGDYLQWSEHVAGWITDTSANGDFAATGGAALRFARELAVFGYFTATVQEFFGPGLSHSVFEAADIDRLARARQAMAVSPVVAERYVAEFRSKLPGWQVPRLLAG
jgi:hypothetical protein